MSLSAFASNPLANGLSLRLYSIPIYGNWLKPPVFPNSPFSRAQLLHWQKGSDGCSTSRWCIKAFASGVDVGVQRRNVPSQPNLDSFLSVVEVFCVAPSVVFAVWGVVGSMVPGVPKTFQVNSGNVAWQFLLLVGAVVVGGLIRHRQWQRISTDNEVAAGCDLVPRIEKLEEDLRSSVTIVRVLSRQLEKLGIRFRVTRKALKEPIAETAALAQKNSEATQALALQEDILEKELGEIQKVLLAMQEQQQKQLDLILAIAKAGRLFESKQGPLRHDSVEKIDMASEKKGSEQMEIKTGRKQSATNDLI